jgi:ubiquinone biosynthesis monooxygenase Coq7
MMPAQSQSLATNNVFIYPTEVIADLRTDHAGETGAVCIYQGVLQFARDQGVRAFSARHPETEAEHFRQIEAWLPQMDRSRLLPLWRLAGWLTGAIPALLGQRAVYVTVQAVEAFVDQHYTEQVHRLESYADLHSLRQTLLACQADELAHRCEAAVALGPVTPGAMLRLWCWLVDAGSRAAVAVCRRI